MNISVLRRKFPEYGDLTDKDLMELCTQLLSDIAEPEDDGPNEVVAIGVTEALDGVKSALDQANKTLTKIVTKPDKEMLDMSPHFMALGMQLSKIETAIKAIQMPEVKQMATQEMKVCTGFKIVRDELGNIDKVIPKYEGA